MDKELLLEKIIEANELRVKNESLNETFETLMEMQESGMIKVKHYAKEGNSIKLEARFLSDTPEMQSSVGLMMFERTKNNFRSF